MHREVEAMEEAVASDREVVMQLEEPPGMVGLGIRLKESSGRISWVFFLHDLWSGTHANWYRR